MPILRLADRVVIPVKYRKLLSLDKLSNFIPFFTRNSLEAFGPYAGKSVKSHAPTMSLPSRNIFLLLGVDCFAAVAPFLRTLFAVKRLDGLYGCEPYGRAMTHAKFPALHRVFCIKPLSKSSAGFPNPSAKTSETSRNWDTNTLWFPPKHCEHSQSFFLLLSPLSSSSTPSSSDAVGETTTLSLLVSAKTSCPSSSSSLALGVFCSPSVDDVAFTTTCCCCCCC
mmetsp:Transcript_5602/g.16299  ORF Transcript_5602/g.16299 Transcript_5602/m.16299 type:complete len:224 (-) Transcript_5602:148-819(-)